MAHEGNWCRLVFLRTVIHSVISDGYMAKEEFTKPCEVLNSSRKNNELN